MSVLNLNISAVALDQVIVEGRFIVNTKILTIDDNEPDVTYRTYVLRAGTQVHSFPDIIVPVNGTGFYWQLEDTDSFTDATTGSLSSGVSSVNGLTGAVSISKTTVGLGNVPNVDATNPANIVQDATHRFITDDAFSSLEASALSATQSASNAQSYANMSEGFYIAALAAKDDAVAAAAQAQLIANQLNILSLL